MVEQWVEGSPLDDLHLKGFNHPVLAVEILRWREEGEHRVHRGPRDREGCAACRSDASTLSQGMGTAPRRKPSAMQTAKKFEFPINVAN